MPIASLTTLANGARQFVVHEAFEMTSCRLLSYVSKFTPRTTVTSSPLAGAEISTFFAPASRCFAAFSRSVKKPVDSMTTSTPRSPQGSAPGSRSASTLSSLPSTSSPASVASTSPGYRPRIESYLSSWASVLESVRSLTATHSTSAFAACAARNTLRPMRPKPLIPTRVGMARPYLRSTADHLDPVPVRVGEVRGVVARPVLRARAGRAVPAPAAGRRGGERRVHGGLARSRHRDMAECGPRTAAACHQPQLRAVDAVGDRARPLEHPAPADREHQGVVEARRSLEVGHLQSDVVKQPSRPFRRPGAGPR